MNSWLNFLIDSLAFGATFMYGSTGEIITEKGGHLNLGIPGVMCMGGAGGCLVLNMIGKSNLPGPVIVVLGILGSLAMAMLMGLIYSFLTVTLRANQNVTGLALTTFGAGLMKVIMSRLSPTLYLVTPKAYYRWPFAGRQDSLQCLGVLFFLGLFIAVAASCDAVANKCEALAQKIVFQHFRFPAEYAEDLLEILSISHKQFETLEQSISQLFSQFGALLKDHAILDEIRDFEYQVDQIEQKLYSKVYSTDMDLAHQMQIAKFIGMLCDISDIVENIADKIQIMLVTRKA